MASALRPYSKLTGVIFGALQKGKKMIHQHPLETNRDEYWNTLRKIVIPEFVKLTSDVPEYPKRAEKLLTYIIPAMDLSWNYNVELIYRTVADEEHQTPENITRAQLLRSIVDLLFCWTTMVDDFTDGAEMRRNEPCWYKICEGGINAAIYDAFQIAFYPYVLLHQHFKDEPGYARMIETLNTGNFKLTIGQGWDVLLKGSSPKMAEWLLSTEYNTGHFYGVGPEHALIFAGIKSEEILTKVRKMFIVFGELFSVWDDFNDYYCSIEEAGKPGTDIGEGVTTWLTARAMEVFTPAQRVEFEKNFGVKDPEKIKRIYELYNEIDVPTLFIEKAIDGAKIINKLISETPNPRVQEACKSVLHWYVGQEILDVASHEKN